MGICTAPVYKMKELNNLFIEMTSKNCNQRCSSCYKEFPLGKNIKDFISVDLVKKALIDTKNENLYCIYLTGAEPMLHPDFNLILRTCLKRCNVCICTNASFLNEKKIRFLKKVEDEGINESSNQIFFKLSLTHYDELLSDKSRFRGNYRQILNSLKTLERYSFVSVLNVYNYYNLPEEEILENFKRIFQERGIKTVDVKITQSYPSSCEYSKNSSPDCVCGRVLSQNGIYSCPFLSNDYRGRVGSSFTDYSKTVNAETNFCETCSKNNGCIFAIG
jgi:MoaA/NifB/PqqE/SkfB family radical SAM enzyme